jgi:hypothetical protein
MSGIANVSEKMKKKISFGDYSLFSEPAKPQETPEKKEARKIYSLSKEDVEKLQKIFTKRLDTSIPSSICEIMSEAIQLLYIKEFS